jgi:hypothetical protein
MAWINTALILTAVSGLVSARGAMVQAEAADQQAKQAELFATNRAIIERQNAQAIAQDEQFQSGVADFNKQEALLKTSDQADLADKQIAAALASQQAKGGRAGLAGASFEDLLNADSLKLEKEEAQILYQGGQEGYQLSKSAELGEMRGKRAIEMGKYSSALAISEGQSQATSLRNQASASRIGAAATLVGTAGAAASIGVKSKTPVG